MKELHKDKDSMFYNPEPWESWETKLVIISIIIAVLGLGVLATLINIFILK